MANLSAMKRVRQNEKRRLRNKSIRTRVFNLFKKLTHTMEEQKSQEEIMNAYKNWQRALDKAVSKGVVHKNTAARRKTRISKRIKSIGKNE